jgi:hypothetical protein
LLYVLTSILGFFAMAYVPDHLIVHGNAAATVSNIAAHEMLFRLGIAAQFIGQAGFIFVALALYKLLEGVNRWHATVMVILIVVPIPIAFVNELNSLAALALVRGADFLSMPLDALCDRFASPSCQRQRKPMATSRCTPGRGQKAPSPLRSAGSA